MRTPPNEMRNFVHKRIGAAAKGFITSGFNPISAATSFLAPAPRRTEPRAVATVRRPVLRSLTARPSATSAQEKQLGRTLKFNASDVLTTAAAILRPPSASIPECGFGKVWDEVRGQCVFGLGQQAGRDDTPIGQPVMGRYGAGEMPGNMVVNRAICRRGMVVGNDGICYNKSQISNKEREWPRGRRPLLTGGDMRAISTAARAGKRLEGATKRLQKIGLMKRPASRARAAKSPPRLTSGSANPGHGIVVVDT